MKALSRALFGVLILLAATEVQAMRWHSPNTGRWFSRDPIGENGGENLNAVWRNDFVNGIDLYGLCPGASCADWRSGEFLLGAGGRGKRGPAGDAKSLCQQTIAEAKKRGGPKELPDDGSCTRCPKELADLQKTPTAWVKRLLDQFGKDCPLPPIRCARCSGAGGWYDDTKKEIVVCHNDTSWNSLAQTLAHELTHALQACHSKARGCKNSLKREMEAYYCAGGAFQFGDLYTDAVQSSCGTLPSQCTPEEVQNLYQELQEWFNKERDHLCTFPRRPDYPATPRSN